jgi:putative Holliday junction resolvase
MPIKRYLGIDMGAKRIGLALGDSDTKLASPRKTVAPHELVRSIEAELPLAGLVIGLPRGLDGQTTPQTLAVQHWVDDLLGSRPEPIFWQDEAGTSSLAEDVLKQSKRNYDKSEIDSGAAAIILQDYLDSL